jgi:TraG-like protein, N-terminal region
VAVNKPFNGIALMVLLLSGANVYALDGSFHVYEGFSQTVSAFKTLSLIFHDHQFQVLAGVFATIGLFSGGFFSFMRAVFSGGQSVQSAIGWLFMPVLGCIIYQATVLPKGNIHIYDKVSNQHQTIGNIPNLLILAASGFNSLEEELRGMVSKNTASPYAKEVNAVSLRLFYNVMMGAADTTSVHYGKSIRRFYDDCMPISNAIEPKFDLDRLLKDTPSIFDELKHLWHPSIFTVFYGDNKRGETLCCTDAWNKLSAWINNPANFQDGFVKICKRQGFSKVEQIPACKREIYKGASFLFGRHVSSDMLFRNAVFAHNIAKSLTDDDPDIQVGAYSNRKIINSGLASATAAQTWMPGIKASVTAIVLSIMPFLLLLLATPLIKKTLILVFSLFAWLTIWGICDAILHQSAIDQMIAAFEEVRSFKMGLWALWEAPTAAIKALAIIAQSRTMAATIAGMISSAIFGFSAYALGSMSGAFTGKVEQEGAAAADRILEPEKAADYMDSIARANAVTNAVGQQGWGAYQGSRISEESQRVARAQGMTGGSGDYSGAGQRAGRGEGAEILGRTEAMSANGQNLEAVARQTAHTETEQRVGGAQGVAAAADGLEQGVQAMQQGISETEMHQRHAGANVSQEINQQIAANNPDNGIAENWHQQSLLAGGAQTKAMGEAANWNSNTLQDTLTAQAQGNFATTQAQQQVAENLGKSFPEMKGDFARWEAMNQAGKNLALEEAARQFGMNPQEYANHVGYGGSIQNLSLTPEHLKTLHDRDKDESLPLIPDHIYEMYKDSGLVLNGVLSRNGNLIKSDWSSSLHASKTTTMDNSLNLGNAASARSALTNVSQVENILRTKGNDALSQATTDALKPIFSMTHQANLHAGMGVSAHMGVGVKVGGSIDKNWSDQTVTDGLYGNCSSLLKALQVEAASQNIDIKDQTHWIAERYTQAVGEVQAYYTQDAAKDIVSVGSAWDGVKEVAGRVKNADYSSHNPFEQYLKNQKMENAHKAFKAGMSIKKGEK